jgi:hypothetical protein
MVQPIISDQAQETKGLTKASAGVMSEPDFKIK